MISISGSGSTAVSTQPGSIDCCVTWVSRCFSAPVSTGIAISSARCRRGIGQDIAWCSCGVATLPCMYHLRNPRWDLRSAWRCMLKPALVSRSPRRISVPLAVCRLTRQAHNGRTSRGAKSLPQPVHEPPDVQYRLRIPTGRIIPISMFSVCASLSVISVDIPLAVCWGMQKR